MGQTVTVKVSATADRLEEELARELEQALTLHSNPGRSSFLSQLHAGVAKAVAKRAARRALQKRGGTGIGSRFVDLDILPERVKGQLTVDLGACGPADSWEHVKAIVAEIEAALVPIPTDCCEFRSYTTEMEKLTRPGLTGPLRTWWEKVSNYCLSAGKWPKEGGIWKWPTIVVDSGYRVLGTTVKGEHYDEYGLRDATRDKWGHWIGYSIDIPTKKWRFKWEPAISKSEFYDVVEPLAEECGLYRPFGDDDEAHWRLKEERAATELAAIWELAKDRH